MDPSAQEASDTVYEEYDPHSEWVHEEGSGTLILVLPGFTREQLRVQITTKGMLRINGTQQKTGKVIRHFYKEFKIPFDYNRKEIRAKFEGGLLFVKLPKSATKPPEAEAPRPQQPSATGPPPPPKPRKEKIEEENNADSRKEEIKEKEENKEDSRKEEQSDIAKGKPNAETYVADEICHVKETDANSLDEKGKTTTSALEENGTLGRLGKHEEKIDKTQEEIVGGDEGYKRPRNLVNLIMAILLFLLFGMYVINAIVSSLGGSKIQEL